MTTKQLFSFDEAVRYIQNSNGIEGIHHTEETIRKVLGTPETRYKPEIVNHYKALQFADTFPGVVDESVCREIHQILMKDLTIQGRENENGIYRTYSVRIGTAIPPAAEHIQLYMDDLQKIVFDCANAVRKKEIKPERMAWIVHDYFEHVHPFGDGNGRTGRLIMNLLRHQYGLPLHIVEYSKRFKYYGKIEQARLDKTWDLTEKQEALEQ